MHRCTNSYKDSASRLNSATLGRISRAITYRVFSCEEERDTAYEGHLADYEHNAIKANLWASAMHPLYQIISMLSVLFIIWFGAENVLGTGWSEWKFRIFSQLLLAFTVRYSLVIQSSPHKEAARLSSSCSIHSFFFSFGRCTLPSLTTAYGSRSDSKLSSGLERRIRRSAY